MQMIFELIDGEMIPVLPRTEDGRPVEPDGSRFFTLAQAAVRSGRPEESLRRRYTATLGRLLPSDDDPTAAAPGSKPARVPVQVQRDLLRVMQYPHFSDDEYEYFLDVCREQRLNPWSKHIVAEKRMEGGKWMIVPITTIHGLRCIAVRTGEYAGQEGPLWSAEDGPWLDRWGPKQPPAFAKVGIKRKGCDSVHWGIACWDEFAVFTEGGKDLAEHWARMPRLMLAKCAAALALRAAFPEQLSGLYTKDEMGQALSRQQSAAGEVRASARAGSIVMPGAYAEQVTPMQFQLALVDLGFDQQWKRDKLVRMFRTDMKFVGEDEMFYRAVLDTVAGDPDRFRALVAE